MKLVHKALVCAVVTEAVALTFVVLDRLYGIESPSWREAALHDIDYLHWRKVTFCSHVKMYAHIPASILVGLTGVLVGAVLEFDGDKMFGDYTLGSPRPSWLLLGVVQAGLWFCFWFALLYLTTRSSALRAADAARSRSP
jgi:hypothetical protein